MAAPYKVYDQKVWVNLTADQMKEVRREIALTGGSRSDVLRAALDAYFAPVSKRQRRKAATS